MTLLPRSLYGRLLVTALVATLAALAFAALTIGAVLDRFVMHGLDERLDAQIAILAQAVRPDGRIDRTRLILAAPYDDPANGWGWRIDAAGRTVASPAPPDLDAMRPPRDGPPPPFAGRDPAQPGALDWRDRHGQLHARSLTLATPAGQVRITASAPRAIVDRPLRAAMAPLLGSLALLGLALGAATLVQLRVGLAPLKRMREGLAAVRSGQATAIPADQPRELAPLASEINALLEENAAALANARGHVANLAHGLKTPLATLALTVRPLDPDGTLGAQIARIDQAVRHHLGRARAATPGIASRVATPLASTVAGLVDALSRIHAERRITAAVAIDPALAVAVDPQDLDELIGNLLDNAWRWASRRIAVEARADGSRFLVLTIADDGPGIPEATRAAALAAGQRLDERGDGHGFGLSIATELATLYGGTLLLDTAALGGLAVHVTLPLGLGGSA
ncbi:sensor histidine kinase [Sphingomonas sp. PAMC 26621]|uniref:sensor histidine kinase n=1 Tax=Sphingomonas sp. PAMC 26621 TaxID=1112213 RepID=UPI0002882578|nr:ATP-binding protein [Sphingomonas sp. PAMC 26621]